MSLIAELQRRNVFRVSAAYLALVWIAAQVTGLVAPVLHLPDSILATVVWVGAIGFPFVVVFAWVFELTPEGLKRESEIDRSRSITGLTARRLDHVVIAFIVVAIALFAYQQIRPPRTEPVAQTPAAVPGTTAPAQVSGAAATTAIAAAIAADDKSIAVLPFVNMSDDKGNEYFSDGIAEELLNVLAKIPELRVIARTSSFAYKGEKLEIPEIAQRLHVANILEGSVRKAGNKVRITAQLVRASDSTHLWSETYDRTLDDIFAVQEEIAGAVVGQLKVTLLGALPETSKDLSPEAYAMLLQAEHFWNQNTPDSLAAAQDLFQRVLAVAPQNPRAWTGLARNYFARASNSSSANEDNYALAREAASKALAFDPSYAPAHALLGVIAISAESEGATAASHIQRALELDPHDPAILSLASRMLANLERVDEAITMAEYVTQRDPVSALGFFRLGYLDMYGHRWDAAITAQRSALALSPDFTAAHYMIGLALLHKGEAQAALEAFEAEQSDEEYRVKGRALALFALGRQEEHERSFAELRERWGEEWPSEVAQVYAWCGEKDQAFAWLDKALQKGEPGLSEQFRQPIYQALVGDPRWAQFRERTGTAEAQLAAIAFEVTLPKQPPQGN